MEVLWIAAGVIGGSVVGYTLARYRADPASPKAAENLVTHRQMSEELDRLRLSMEDIYDKTFHLYDRVRKRVTKEEAAAEPAPPFPDGDRKGAIRARARAAGIYR